MNSNYIRVHDLLSYIDVWATNKFMNRGDVYGSIYDELQSLAGAIEENQDPDLLPQYSD